MNLSELRTALQERREDYSSTTGKLTRKLNQAYLDICSRRKWGWLRRTHTYATYPSVSTHFEVASGHTGETEFSVQLQAGASVDLLPTTVGKTLKIDNDFYRLENILEADLAWSINRPLRCAAPNPGVFHPITIYYDEVALPVGAVAVVETVLFRGANSYPTSMSAVSPAEMAHYDRDVEGSPSRFSTVRKEPIPVPLFAPTVAVSAATPSGDGLATGTYTYWYTYVDKQTGAESALGPTSSLAVGSGQQVEVSSVAAKSDFYIRLYRSIADGDNPFLAYDPQDIEVAALALIWRDSLPDHHLGRRGPESSSTLFLRLYPVPDGEYEVTSVLQMEAKRMGADNDRPLFDAQFHHIILDGAESYMMEASDEHGRANQARQRFEAGIARMIQQDRLNIQQRVVMGGPLKAVGGPAWWYGSLPPYDASWSIK